MNERKHLAERVLDFIDVTRRARKSINDAPTDIGSALRLSLDSEIESLETYMEKAWLRIERLDYIAEQSLGKGDGAK